MLIRCKVLRPGGTRVTLPGGPRAGYHFKPAEKGDPDDHVCQVTDEDHIRVFLLDDQHYVPMDGQKVPDGLLPPPPPPPTDEHKIVVERRAEAWTNNELRAWAQSLGVNPTNKEAIVTAGRSFQIKLDDSKAPSEMIRDLACALGVTIEDAAA